MTKNMFTVAVLAVGIMPLVAWAAADPCRMKSGTIAHEVFCDKYYTCVNNQSVVKDCPNGLVYTGLLNQICDFAHNVDCGSRSKRIFAVIPTTYGQQQRKQEQLNPCEVKGKIVADVTYCDRYWECVNGQPELYDCPNGLAFAGRNRGVADGCDYPWRVNQESRNCIVANPPISTEHCDWLYGIFGHETSCTRYWTCWNGTATEQLCIGGLLYNEETHACDWPEAVPGCQKHPLCKDDPNGNVALGKSCNRYWNCQGGYPRLQRCPAMLVFDKRSLRCVVPPTEDCDIPSTTPPPPEEEEDQNKRPSNNQQQQTRIQAQPIQLRPQDFPGVRRVTEFDNNQQQSRNQQQQDRNQQQQDRNQQQHDRNQQQNDRNQQQLDRQ